LKTQPATRDITSSSWDTCRRSTASARSNWACGSLNNALVEEKFKEIIIATNPTVEGDATAHFLADMANRHKVPASRIAHGVPLGGELEYVDGGTLSHAFFGRRLVE
jgi:recombinational DNA repair protein RecR